MARAYLRRGIGTVFQDFRLLPNKTVFANVSFALQVIGKSRAAMSTLVPDVLETVGLAGKEKRYPHELSGGEQQRVAIARAVVNKPGILLADEPTGNLDPVTSADIMAVLEKINRNGTTVLMATHDGEIVNRMAKRVIESPRVASSATSSTARTESPHEGRLHPLRGRLRPEEELLDGALGHPRHLRLPPLRRRGHPPADAGGADEGLLVRPRPGLGLPLPPDSEATNCVDGEVTDAQKKNIEDALAGPELAPYVDTVYFEDKAEAYKHFQDQFKGTSLEGTVPESDMNESYRIKLKDAEKYEIIKEYFSSTQGVEEVVDQNQLLDRLFGVLNVATVVAVVIAGIMLLCAMLLIATTIRLSAFARRRETGIMRLVGASNSFIQLPFLLEGVIAAAIGATLAAGTLGLLVHFGVSGWLQEQATGFNLISGVDVSSSPRSSSPSASSWPAHRR